MAKPVGLTKDVGWQIGVRRTLPIGLNDAWRLVISPEGLEAWLGAAEALDLVKGGTYRLKDGTKGEIRVFKSNSHIRLTWHPPGWDRSSTIQVRVVPNKGRAVIVFHQEHLPGPEAREARRTHFIAAMDELERLVPAD